jgi:hypothetical protein
MGVVKSYTLRINSIMAAGQIVRTMVKGVIYENIVDQTSVLSEGVLDTLKREAQRNNIDTVSRESIDWFRKTASKLRNVSMRGILEDNATTTRPSMGSMLMFTYDPIGRTKLPYYDAFPLVIPVKKAPGGFHGLNLHYLPLPLRAAFLDELLNRTSGRDENRRFRLTYELLKNSAKLSEFKPCYKHYLTKQINSRIAKISPEHWTSVAFLPTERFQKASKTAVWRDSRGKI